MKSTLIILTPGFPENETDTTCLPPQQVFVKALKENNPQLDILVISFQYPYQNNSYLWHGIEVESFGGRNKGGLSRRLLWSRILKRLEQVKQEKKIMGVFSFWCGECAWIGKKFSGKHAIPHYNWILGQDAKENNKYVKKIHPDSNELVALSDFIADEFEKNYQLRPGHIIPPGVDTQLFKNTTAEKDIDILGAGSLIPLKQFDVFLQIIAAIKKEFPDIKAVLAGDGPEKERLQEIISQAGLEDNVTLAGELPHVEVLKLMQRTKVFLHTSSYEGFGVVCIEALQAAASVVSFCKPMKKEIANWYIATTSGRMASITSKLLKENTVNNPSSPFLIQDSAAKVMELFSPKAIH